MSKENKVSVFPILMVNFIGALGYSIVFPFLVFLVTKFGGNALVYGIIGAVYPAFQLIGAPLLGKWSDIYGRKKILMLSETGTFTGWIIFFISFFLPLTVILNMELPFAGTIVLTLPLIVLFTARAIDGITGGNISVANAYMSDITPEKERNKNFGRLAVSQNLGFIMGPAIAGVLGGTVYGEMIPVMTAALISFIAIVTTYFYLPDPAIKTYTEKDDQVVKKILGYEGKECYEHDKPGDGDLKFNLKKALRIQSVGFFLMMNFLIFLGFNFFYTAFPIHVTTKLGWTITQMGIFFSVLSGVMVLVQGPVLSIASKKFSEKILIITGSFILGTSFVMLLSDQIAVLYLSAVCFALGNGLMWPSFLSMLSKTAGKKYQGAVQGYASSAGSLASIIGLIAGGLLYESIGVMTFIFSAAIIFFVMVLSLKLPSAKAA